MILLSPQARINPLFFHFVSNSYIVNHCLFYKHLAQVIVGGLNYAGKLEVWYMLLDYCHCIEITSLRSPNYGTFYAEILWSVNYIVDHQYVHPIISLVHSVCHICFSAYDVIEARLY